MNHELLSVLALSLVQGCVAGSAPVQPREAGQGSRAPVLPNPFFQSRVGLGLGELRHNTSGSGLDDDVDASTLRLTLEGTSPSGFGGGVALEFTGTDDDLFEGQEVAGGEAGILEVFAHATYRLSPSDYFRMPIRLGPYFHGYELEDDGPSDLTWLSVGGRVELEPEVLVHRGPHSEVGIFAVLSGGIHVTSIELDTPTGDEDFDSDGYSAGVSAGVRARWKGFTTGLSYYSRWFNVDESDPEGNLFIREINTRLGGVMFEIGLSF